MSERENDLPPDFTWRTRAEKLLVVDYWWHEQKGRCCMCAEPMEPYHRDASRNPNAASVEHLIPKRDGGPDTLENVRLAHRSCNNRAGAQWSGIEYLRQVRVGLLPAPKAKRRRPAYVFEEREKQPVAVGTPFVGLNKQLVSLPRGATLTPMYRGFKDEMRPQRPSMNAGEIAAWLKLKGVRGS